jgi:hypothetical protein
MYEATLSRGIEEEEWKDVVDVSADEARADLLPALLLREESVFES